MCGIIGLITNNIDSINITYKIYELLFNLQHRGQDSFGIVTYNNKTENVFCQKNQGLVDNNVEKIDFSKSNMGIGHVRYPTHGNNTINEIQPFTCYFNNIGISLVHNGNIYNVDDIRLFLNNYNYNFNSTSDSEVILILFYHFIKNDLSELDNDLSKLDNDLIIKSIYNIYDLCKGSFSIILMIHGYGIIAVRDKYGIRPFVYNKFYNSVEFSSETIGLTEDSNYQNVENGEVIIVDNYLNISKYRLYNEILKPCIFEYIYFSRQESYINDVLVYDFRHNVGEEIASDIDIDIINDIDIIVPVPLTSIISASAIAHKINKPLKHVIQKNRYTHRTFINKEDEIIKNIKKIKIIKSLVKGKNLLLVDDSIVRGNTSKYIINLLRDAGANKIYFACCSPPIKFPNCYGICLYKNDELIANNKSIEEVCEYLNLDKLYYLSLENTCNVLKKLNPKLQDFELSVFTGNYI